MWRYTIGVLGLWLINPELRRLFGWRFGHTVVEDVLSALPLLVLIPHCWSLTVGGRWRRVPRLLVVPTWLWISGFTYALAIAFLSGNFLPATYSFAKFVLPMGLGLWIASDAASNAIAFRNVTRALFAFTTLVSVYGVVQYVFAPAWDALWVHQLMEQGTAQSFGRPFPFEIRTFSTLNSPGPFGNFMALMLLLALPQLSLRRPLFLAQLPLWLVAFGLSLVRSAWLMFAGALIVYFIFTPRRGALLATGALMVPIFAGLCIMLPAVIGNDSILTSLNERFDTLSNLDSDTSGRARRALYDEGLNLLAPAPFGLGLGVVGTATQLGDAGTPTDLDSGVLARSLEMGIPGVGLFLGALALMIRASLSAWRVAGLLDDLDARSVAAAALAIEAGLVGLQFAGDLDGLLVLLLWLVVSLSVYKRPQIDLSKLTLAAA